MTDTVEPFDPLAFIASVPWKAATSEHYARPGLHHEYVTWYGLDPPGRADFDRFREHVRQNASYRRRFGKHRYAYWEPGDGLRYWCMWRVANRCPADATWDDPREEAGQMKLPDR